MPLYEYQCDACGHRFELIQKFSDPPAQACVSCGGPVRKLLSSPAFQFKGSGWYITDYARKGSSPTSDGESKPAAESADKPAVADTKRDGKSEASSPSTSSGSSSPSKDT